jgi:hypothetical protein
VGVSALKDGRDRLLSRAALVVGCALLVVGSAAGTSVRRSGERVAAPAVAFPLRIAPSRRYLVDVRGTPFLVVGDSPQSLPVNLSLRQAATFMASRRAEGFNTLWLDVVCNKYNGGRADGSTRDGVRPFTRVGNLATPNPRYFARVDAVLRLAAHYGFLVYLDPIETGGWLRTLLANGVAKDYAYGRYIGRRYRDFANVVWISGNDHQYWRNAIDDGVVLAVARGIASVAPKQLQTVELDYPRSSSHDDKRWDSLVDIDSAYTYFPNYAEVLTAVQHAPTKPALMVETSYEGTYWYSGPQTLRRGEWWSALAGAAGQFYGNPFVWPFKRGWQSHLNTTGVVQLGYLTTLLRELRWYEFVPDVGHTVVTAGYGTFAPDGNVNTSDYVTAARRSDGQVVIAYLPTTATLTIDLSRLAGPVTAHWYDPTSGTSTAVGGGPFGPGGTTTFTPPGANRSGDQDWVLVLTAS